MRPSRFVCALIVCSLLPLSAVGQDDDAQPPYFTIVLMPDTQYYAEQFPHLYQAQCQWIRDNAESQNIQFVIHLGDIVQNRNENEDEWKVAREAHRLLDGVVPYSVAPGNHDQTLDDRNSSLYNKYFPASDFEQYQWYGGRMGDDNDNNYCFLDVDGLKFLILNLEYGPDEKILDWANQIVKQHPDRRVIVATHHYMAPRGRHPHGQRVWDQLVYDNPNIFMVVCGHVGALSLQTSVNQAGNTVYEILTDFQSMGDQGGGGWLRRLQFYPTVNRIVSYDFCVVDGNTMLGDIFHNYLLHYDMTAE